MAKPIDYLMDPDTLDDLVRNGDRAVGDATIQNQNLILRVNKGEYKQYPDIGVGLANFIDDESPDELMREIRKQYVKDGMNVKDIAITGDGKLKIDADY